MTTMEKLMKAFESLRSFQQQQSSQNIERILLKTKKTEEQYPTCLDRKKGLHIPAYPSQHCFSL
uniref:Uncharacterized protein n=1 Tax=Varanus komodoensis TaxID=61221 RepID=A0A8D2JH43_VARKO